MDGGIDAWNGLVSHVQVDQGVYLLEGDETAAEVFAIAYGLEEATRRFYAKVADQAVPQEIRDLALSLSAAEVGHKERIRQLCLDNCGGLDEFDSFLTTLAGDTLEDGTPMESRLEGVLEDLTDPGSTVGLAMSVEVDALDLYLRLARHVRDQEAKNSLLALAEEEKAHLRRLGKMRERWPGGAPGAPAD